MKIIHDILFFLIVCLFMSFEVVAQGPVPEPFPADPPPGGPIDSGVVLLFVVGLFFGLYKIHISILKKKRSI